MNIHVCQGCPPCPKPLVWVSLCAEDNQTIYHAPNMSEHLCMSRIPRPPGRSLLFRPSWSIQGLLVWVSPYTEYTQTVPLVPRMSTMLQLLFQVIWVSSVYVGTQTEQSGTTWHPKWTLGPFINVGSHVCGTPCVTKLWSRLQHAVSMYDVILRLSSRCTVTCQSCYIATCQVIILLLPSRYVATSYVVILRLCMSLYCDF